MTSNSSALDAWRNQFFDLRYLEMFMTRSAEQRRHDARLIKHLASLQPGQRVADFCCGIGDVLQELMREGLLTHGVEGSEAYVRRAQEQFPLAGVQHGNAYSHRFGLEFDAVYNWWSSIGYGHVEDDRRLLANMVRQLVPGGRILLETYNSYPVIQNFQPRLEYERSLAGRTYHVTRDARISLEDRRIHQRWTFTASDESWSHDTSTRLYFADELVAALQEAGATDVRIWETPTLEDPTLKPFTMSSPRLLLMGSHP